MSDVESQTHRADIRGPEAARSKCWGSMYLGANDCPTSFEPQGLHHLKNKFCDQCRARSFSWPGESIRMISNADKVIATNTTTTTTLHHPESARFGGPGEGETTVRLGEWERRLS